MLTGLSYRLRALFHRDRVEQELEGELRFHLERETRKLTERGVPLDHARRQARLAFGGTRQTQEACREAGGWTWLDHTAQDLRYAWRQFRRSPGFATVVITTLALGIGVNTVVFSVVDAALLRPLPFAEAERLVRIWQQLPVLGKDHLGASAPEYQDYAASTHTFEQVAAYKYLFADLTGEGEPQRVSAVRAPAGLFPLLRAQPLTGRTYTSAEEQTGASHVAVLSHGFWLRHYGASAKALGTTIRLDEQPYTVIGIMPERFTFPATPASASADQPDLWIPLVFTPQEQSDRAGSLGFSLIARLRTGESVAQAQEDISRAAHLMVQAHPDIYRSGLQLQATVEPLLADSQRRARPLLALLTVAVALLLLIACANVAHLQLARAAAREREVLVRAALGTSTGRLLRQSLTEALLWTSLGGAAGLVLAAGLLRWASTFAMDEVNLSAARMDTRALAFTVGLSLLTGVLCGLAPAWQGRRLHHTAGLRRSGTGRRGSRLRSLLVVAEAACALVLLAGCALLVHSMVRVLQTPLGFEPEGVLLLRASFNRHRYPTVATRRLTQQSTATRLAALPGVQSVGLSTNLPLSYPKPISYRLANQDFDGLRPAFAELVDGDYFRTLGIPLLAGRTFQASDRSDAPAIVIVNQTLARRSWPGGSALSQRIIWGERQLTVVGVVGDVHEEALDRDVPPVLYLPIHQAESAATAHAVFLLRMATGVPQRLSPAARAAVRSVDHELVLDEITTMPAVVADALATRRLLLIALAGFAGAALLLALVGLYGVLAYQVVQRTQEMGVRLALGAPPGKLLGQVVWQGLALTGAGVVLGLLACLALHPLLSTFLYSVRPADPLALGLAVLTLLATGAAAAFVPARRAAGVDPVIALRQE